MAFSGLWTLGWGLTRWLSPLYFGVLWKGVPSGLEAQKSGTEARVKEKEEFAPRRAGETALKEERAGRSQVPELCSEWSAKSPTQEVGVLQGKQRPSWVSGEGTKAYSLMGKKGGLSGSNGAARVG